MNNKTDSAYFDELACSKLNEIGFSTEFQCKLLNDDDDWSFVIKIHAILESVLSSLLVQYFNEPKLEEVFANLEMGNVKSGKIKIIEKLGIINMDQIDFIRKLGALRNSLIHNIKNIDFSFEKNKDKAELNELLKSASKNWTQGLLKGDKNRELLNTAVELIPRGMIGVVFTWCVLELALAQEKSSLRNLRANNKRIC